MASDIVVKVCSGIGFAFVRYQVITWTTFELLQLDHKKYKIFQWNFIWNSEIFIQEYALENVCKMLARLSMPQCVKLKA